MALQKKFAVIVADPPWDIAQRNEVKGAAKHYRLMSRERIASLPVEPLAADDATLFLWSTSAALPFALEVMERWGFSYKSHAVWDKYYMGLGRYFRSSHEVLLHGTRGHAPWNFHGQRSTLLFPRTEHSTKPFEVFTLIERVLDGPYLELFARRRPNTAGDWSVWGDQVASDVVIPGYPVPSDRARRRHDNSVGE